MWLITNLRYFKAAERTLFQAAGRNMNTWMVGTHPFGHFVRDIKPRANAKTGAENLGEKTFFLKSRIMAGQADLSTSPYKLVDFKWLSKDEISQFVHPQYYSQIKNMLADR